MYVIWIIISLEGSWVRHWCRSQPWFQASVEKGTIPEALIAQFSMAHVSVLPDLSAASCFYREPETQNFALIVTNQLSLVTGSWSGGVAFIWWIFCSDRGVGVVPLICLVLFLWRLQWSPWTQIFRGWMGRFFQSRCRELPQTWQCSPNTSKIWCLVFFFWYNLMEENCSHASPSSIQNQHVTGGIYEIPIYRHSEYFSIEVAWVLQMGCREGHRLLEQINIWN